jgi:hypothetical protein
MKVFPEPGEYFRERRTVPPPFPAHTPHLFPEGNRCFFIEKYHICIYIYHLSEIAGFILWASV